MVGDCLFGDFRPSWVALSRWLGPKTAQYGEGSRPLFDGVNARGGVHGRMIRYATFNDAFDLQKAVENTRQLLENDKVFIIFRSTGTAQTAAILPLIKEHRTLFFGPVTGASLQWLDLSSSWQL